jgi:hypothetical protein
VDCVTQWGWWDSGRQAWCEDAFPTPPASDPRWKGKSGGSIIVCKFVAYKTDGTPVPPDGGFTLSIFVAPTDTGGTGSLPRQVADMAVASMQLRPGQVGLTPPSIDTNPNSMAIIGIPVWLWVADPGESTTGPITRTATSGAVTVTATATLDRIAYDLGDGAVLSCDGPNAPGTPATPNSNLMAGSPTCGHTYQRTSAGQPDTAYTIQATAYWTVRWSGGGDSGTIPLELSTTARLRVGEIQTIITS